MSDEQEKYKSVKALLIRVLASIVYHSDALMEVAVQKPSHPFLMIPILQDQNLLEKLKKLVSTEPSIKIDAPTGIPPFVITNRKLNQVLQYFEEHSIETKAIFDKVDATVEKCIEKHAVSNGHLTLATFRNTIQNVVQEQTKKLELIERRTQDNFAKLCQCLKNDGDPTRIVHEVSPLFQQNMVTANNTTDSIGIIKWRHTWGGKMWDVPQNFGFPKTGTFLKVAWKLWLVGMPNFKKPDGTPAPIMPFKCMNPNFLPKEMKSVYRMGWSPILTKMMSTPNIPLSSDTELTNDTINNAFDVAFAYLRTQYSYIFENPKFKNHSDWLISTWSKNTKYSMVMTHGTDEDKANLPAETRMNRKRKGRSSSENTNVCVNDGDDVEGGDY